MSFLMYPDKDRRLVDAYPPAATNIAGATFDSTTAEAERWKCIPRDADMSKWLRIMPRTRLNLGSREYCVLYDESVRPPPRENAPFTVTIYLYGFIESMNLSLTGDWDQTEGNARKAKQSVRLCGGPRPEIFKAQGDALSSLEQHIIGTLRGGGLPAHIQDSMISHRRRSLHIGRRVFEKVTPSSRPSVPISGPAASMVNRWRITETPRLGYRQDNLSLKACNAAKISPGDFVQVQTKFVVVTKEGRFKEPPKVTVHLNLLSVVRLVACRDVAKVMPGEVPRPVAPVVEEVAVFKENVDEGPEMS